MADELEFMGEDEQKSSQKQAPIVVQKRDDISFPDDTSDRGELFRAVFAEFLAMTMFVFMGCGSVAATGEFLVDDAGLGVKVSVARVLPIATAFGLSIVVLAFNIAPISGGHINPGKLYRTTRVNQDKLTKISAVTYALMLQRKISPWRTFLYMLAQFIGAVFGAALLWGGISNASYVPNPALNMTGSGFRPGIDIVRAVGKPPFGLGANMLNPVLSVSNGLLLEIMGTSLLIGTVLSTAVDPRSLGKVGALAPIPIGFSVWIVHLVLIPWTGCGINPARTFGPAVVNSFAGVNTWGDSGLVIYFLGPFLGATLTSLAMTILWGGIHPPVPKQSAVVVDDF